MHKHVAPAEPTACIPDPSRGGDLPPGGARVVWSAYWAGLLARGDVTVSEELGAPAILPIASVGPASLPERYRDGERIVIADEVDPYPSVPEPADDEHPAG